MNTLMNYLLSIPWKILLNTSIASIFCVILMFFIIKKIAKNSNIRINYWYKLTLEAGKKPALFLITIYIFYFTLYIISFILSTTLQQFYIVLVHILPVLIMWSSVILALWFIWRLSDFIQNILKNEQKNSAPGTMYIILSIINNILHAIILLIAVNMIITELPLSSSWKELSEKMLRVYLIGTIGWLLYKIINGIEKIILLQFDINNDTNFSAKKIQTQVLILKRIIVIIGFIVVVACALFVFDDVKRLGIGLMTTAGIISAIGAFASQQSLGRLISGLQLAFTQPIRIGDTVVVDDQMGVVEEITISYVVVKLWDLRRLIIPTDHIMSRGFQNLTRTSTQLLGTIYIYIDYLLPIDALREKFIQLVSESNLWDKNVCTLQVTEQKEHTLEVRGLLSAKNGADLWALRCDIREKILAFIVNTYPDCLPKVRQLTFTPHFETM